MKKDIQNRNDIELLVNAFCEKIGSDKHLELIFREITHVNWSTYLPAMYSFWENIILYTGTYEGNPLNFQHPYYIKSLNKIHFDRWTMLFTGIVDELFEAEKASLAKFRATSIAGILQEKIMKYQQGIKDIY